MEEKLAVLDIDKMTQEQRGEIAFNKHNKIIQLGNSLQKNFWGMAKELWEIHYYKFYQDLDYETFDEYIQQPELKIHRAWAYILCRVHEIYVLKLQIPEDRLLGTDISKLNDIAPYINTDNQEELLDTAQELSRKDLKIYLDGNKISSKSNINNLMIEPGVYRLIRASDCVKPVGNFEKRRVEFFRDDVGIVIRI